MNEDIARFISFHKTPIMCRTRLDANIRLGVGVRRGKQATQTCPLCGQRLQYLISLPLQWLTHRHRDIYDINWCSTHRCPRRFEGTGDPHFVRRPAISTTDHATRFRIVSAGFETLDESPFLTYSKLGGFARGTAADPVTVNPILASIECSDLLESSEFPGNAALIVTGEHDQFTYHMQL